MLSWWAPRIVGVAAALLAGSACSGGANQETAGASTTQVTITAPTTTQDAIRPVALPSTSTSITLPPLPRDVASALLAKTVGDGREDFAKALEDQLDIELESVDQFTYDMEAEALVVSVSSAYRSDEGVEDVAWAVTRALLPLFEVDRAEPPFEPQLRLTVNRTRFQCFGDLMQRLVALTAGRAEWTTECERP